jgi:hypothetical protein
MPSAFILSVVMLNDVMLNVVMLNVVTLNVVMLNVIMLSVVAPSAYLRHAFKLFKGLISDVDGKSILEERVKQLSSSVQAR